MNVNSLSVGKLCRRFARQIWREQPDLSVEDMLKRDEILQIALNGQKYHEWQILEWITPEHTPHEELDYFWELDMWTIQEAVALWSDINPFILLQSFKSSWGLPYHPNFRAAYHLLIDKAKRSVISGELIGVRNGDDYFVTPHNFYVWAIDHTNDQIGTRTEDFFYKLEMKWKLSQPQINNSVSKVEEKRNEISRILNVIHSIDRGFSYASMPGRKKDFHDLCKQKNKSMFTISQSTFNDYLKGLCTFNGGARETDYYKIISTKWPGSTKVIE